MAITFENITMLLDDEARAVIGLVGTRGPRAAVEQLTRDHRPGSGTLLSTRREPWTEGDEVREVGDYILYFDRTRPRLGLIWRVRDPAV